MLRTYVTGNSVSVLPGALDAIRVQVRNDKTICAKSIANNSSNGGGGAGFVQLVARQANTAVFNMEGLALGAQTAAAMEAFLEAQNPLIPAAEVLTFVATNFTGVAANTCGTTIP